MDRITHTQKIGHSHGFEHVLQELPSGLSICLLDELSYGKLACAINAYEQVELAFSSLNLGDVDMKEADGVAFELLRFGLSPSTLGKREMPCR